MEACVSSAKSMIKPKKGKKELKGKKISILAVLLVLVQVDYLILHVTASLLSVLLIPKLQTECLSLVRNQSRHSITGLALLRKV